MRAGSVRNESPSRQSPQDKSIVWLPGLFSDRGSGESVPARRQDAKLSIAKWPFLLGDVLLLAAAYVVCTQSARPMGLWQVGLVVLCVAGGVCLSIAPFVLEYRMLARLAEAWAPTTAAEQLPEQERVAAPPAAGREQAQNTREEPGEATAAGEGNARSTGTETQGSTELTQPIKDSENANLRLEVDRLRRLEHDWLQVLVQMLDHVYALQVGALRSGQPSLIEQVSQFQDACREAARRIGLKPFIADPGEPFDTQQHQGIEGEGAAPAGAIVAETIAPGYILEGRVLRRALVRLVSKTESI